MSIEVMGGGGGVELPSWKYTTYSPSKEYDTGDVCWGGDRFVAVKRYFESGNGYSDIYISFDGISWDKVANTNGLERVSYGFGKYFLTGLGTGGNFYSVDGINWQSGTAASKALGKLIYGIGTFITMQTDGGNAYSKDGLNWSVGNLGNISSATNTIAYGNGMFVAVVYGGTTTAYSYDGVYWNQGGNLPISADWSNVGYNEYGKYFFATSYNRNVAVYSTDGINWNQGIAPVPDISIAQWGAIGFGDNKLVITDARGGSISYQTNYDKNWVKIPNVLYKDKDNPKYRPIAYGNGTFVALSFNGTDKNKFFYLKEYFPEWDV